MKVDPAHYIAPDEGRGGYWRQFGEASDGRTLCACGLEKKEAEEKLALAMQQREEYLKLPILMRLKVLADGDLLSTDMGEAVRLIIQHLRDNDRSN